MDDQNLGAVWLKVKGQIGRGCLAWNPESFAKDPGNEVRTGGVDWNTQEIRTALRRKYSNRWFTRIGFIIQCNKLYTPPSNCGVHIIKLTKIKIMEYK